VSVILSKILHMYMCPLPNGFRDRAISLYSSKIVNKKEILRHRVALCILTGWSRGKILKLYSRNSLFNPRPGQRLS
jgi:hypothetical protein